MAVLIDMTAVGVIMPVLLIGRLYAYRVFHGRGCLALRWPSFK
jgi:cytochrome bd-type quinol oxidase subunit 2